MRIDRWIALSGIWLLIIRSIYIYTYVYLCISTYKYMYVFSLDSKEPCQGRGVRVEVSERLRGFGV